MRELDIIQDVFNTEPDVTIEVCYNGKRYLIIIEVKLLSEEGLNQFDRQLKLGNIFKKLMGYETKHILITSDWLQLVTSQDIIKLTFSEVLDIFNCERIERYGKERAFYHDNNFLSISNKSIRKPQKYIKEFKEEDVIIFNQERLQM